MKSLQLRLHAHLDVELSLLNESLARATDGLPPGVFGSPIFGASLSTKVDLTFIELVTALRTAFGAPSDIQSDAPRSGPLGVVAVLESVQNWARGGVSSGEELGLILEWVVATRLALDEGRETGPGVHSEQQPRSSGSDGADETATRDDADLENRLRLMDTQDNFEAPLAPTYPSPSASGTQAQSPPAFGTLDEFSYVDPSHVFVEQQMDAFESPEFRSFGASFSNTSFNLDSGNDHSFADDPSSPSAVPRHSHEPSPSPQPVASTSSPPKKTSILQAGQPLMARYPRHGYWPAVVLDQSSREARTYPKEGIKTSTSLLVCDLPSRQDLLWTEPADVLPISQDFKIADTLSDGTSPTEDDRELFAAGLSLGCDYGSDPGPVRTRIRDHVSRCDDERLRESLRHPTEAQLEDEYEIMDKKETQKKKDKQRGKKRKIAVVDDSDFVMADGVASDDEFVPPPRSVKGKEGREKKRNKKKESSRDSRRSKAGSGAQKERGRGTSLAAKQKDEEAPKESFVNPWPDDIQVFSPRAGPSQQDDFMLDMVGHRSCPGRVRDY
ncbi:hypothetical protein RQP46_002541 [Phenoliferia psychrophenolica]